MFFGASSFNQQLNKWDVSNVEDMNAMFAYTTSFNQPLNKWDVSSVTSMYRMFERAGSLRDSAVQFSREFSAKN